jgi:hypothetical protein
VGFETVMGLVVGGVSIGGFYISRGLRLHFDIGWSSVE